MRFLIDENPLMFQPSIVALIGLERAIILQLIHHLTEYSIHGTEVDDDTWIGLTSQEFHDQYSPFWAVDSIRKWIASLERLGVLVSARFDQERWDQRKYYRVNYAALQKKLKALHQSSEGNLHEEILDQT